MSYIVGGHRVLYDVRGHRVLFDIGGYLNVV